MRALGPFASIAECLAAGQFPWSEKIGPAMELAMFTILNLYVSAMDWWNGLEPYKRGYYQGYILFEVVAAVVSGLLTAPAGGSGAAVILARHAPKFGMVLKKLGAGLTRLANAAGDSLGPLRNVIDDLLTRITGAKAGGWCFVAGTMIMTAQGAVPIEQIRKGDLVWSAHEETGKLGLAPVMELYRNEAEEIWTVRYAGSEDGAPVRELRCTGEHPFWSETEQSFVPARELKPGGELRLFGGESARVLSVTPRRGPPGEMTRVYNFAVAGHHTYYAGEDGVWVHNLFCKGKVDEFVALHKTKFNNLGGTAAAWDEALDFTLEAAAVEKRMPLDDTELRQIALFLFENNPRLMGEGADWFAEIARFRQKTRLPTSNTLRPVAVAKVDDLDAPIFGLASGDLKEAVIDGVDQLARLRSKYLQQIEQTFGKPIQELLPHVNDPAGFLKHAEAMSLMRAAQHVSRNGGSLVGKTARIRIDWADGTCPRCIDGLPYLLKALGMPEIDVINHLGRIQKITAAIP